MISYSSYIVRLIILVSIPFLSFNLFAKESQAYHSLLKFFTESPSGNVDYHREAIEKCTVEFEKDNTSNRKSYKLKKLKFSRCDWKDQINGPIKSIGSEGESFLQEGIEFQNVEVSWETFMCSAELILPKNRRVKMEGWCAPRFRDIADQNITEKIGHQDVRIFQNSMITFLKASKKKNALDKAVNTAVRINNETLSLIIGLAIPILDEAAYIQVQKRVEKLERM